MDLHALVWRVFDQGFRPWMDTRVRLHVAGRLQVSDEGPLILVANHESFWDGFLLKRVQERLRPGAPFAAVMLERELASRPLLRLLGGVGIEPGSLTSARRMMRTLADLPRDAVLAYFPQGRITPGSPRPLRFEAGITRVIGLMAPATVVPVGLRLLQGVTPRSEAYVSVAASLASSALEVADPALLAAEVEDQLDAIEALVDRHGEKTPERWPSPGRALERPATTVWGPDAPWISQN